MAPMHPNPSCYWQRLSRADERAGRQPIRIANIFHRDKVGVIVLQLRGDDYNVDAMAKLIASGKVPIPPESPPVVHLTVDSIAGEVPRG